MRRTVIAAGIAIAGLSLAACSSASPNPAACKTAMARDYAYAIAHPDAPPAVQPVSCKGLPTATLNKIVSEIMAGPASPKASPPPVRTPKPVAIDYRAQYLADVVTTNHDIDILDAIVKSGVPLYITSPAFVRYGIDSIASGRMMLHQTWPASVRADIHELALDSEKVGTDISLQNMNQQTTDGAAVTAQAQVVRAELGLASVPK